MASKTEICNFAIAHLGVSSFIDNIASSSSVEALTCNLFYNTALEATLGDHPWVFATKERPLSLVTEDPNELFKFSYRYPTDCIKDLRIQSSAVYDDRSTRIGYEVRKDSVGKVIYTDQEDAILEYIEKVTDTQLYDADFILAFSFRLAAYIAPNLTKGDPYKMKNEMLNAYLMEISTAKANNLNKGRSNPFPASESISARN